MNLLAGTLHETRSFQMDAQGEPAHDGVHAQ
jgi:hypothetical protein